MKTHRGDAETQRKKRGEGNMNSVFSASFSATLRLSGEKGF